MPRAARAVGVLVAVFDFVAMGLLHLHAIPVGFHFLGDDQRQAGAHARSHLGAMRDDGDGPVGGDRDEHLGVDDDAMRHLAGAGFISEGRARHHGRGKHEAAGDAEAFEDIAARDVLDLADVPLKAAELSGVCDDVHDQTPVEARCTAFSMRW